MSDRVIGHPTGSLCRPQGRMGSPFKAKGQAHQGRAGEQPWVKARVKAGLPKSLVLYCARHDFSTYVLQKTGNIAVVLNTMGHSDVKTAMT